MNRGVELVKSSRFTTQEVEGALLTLAINGGNTESAAKQLNAAGVDVSARTLRDWRTKVYPRLYANMFTRHRALIQDQVVNDALANAAFAGQAVRLGLEETLRKLEAGEVRDPSSAGKNAAIIQGISVEKAALLSGLPTVRVEHTQADEIMRAIRARVGFLDGEAEEEPGAA
jgi:hypothetical protein